MFDSLAVARQLTDAGIDRDQAAAIADAVRQAAEHGNHVTSDQFKAGLAELRTEIANLETRLIKWVLGIVLTVAALQTAILVAILRLQG